MNKEKLRILSHFVAGFLILLHGWMAYQKSHSSSWIFMLLGVIFLLIAMFHKRLQKRFSRVDGVFFLVESMAISAMAYDYFHEHKTYLPWIMILAAIIYFVLSILVFSGKKKMVYPH